MFILPPNCIVPSATSLTMSPAFPSFLYFSSHAPPAANKNCDSESRICPNSDSVRSCGSSDTRMVLRIKQGQGREDRYALLPPLPLERLRTWRAARVEGE